MKAETVPETIYNRLRRSFLLLAIIPVLLTGTFVATVTTVRQYRMDRDRQQETARRIARRGGALFSELEKDLATTLRIRGFAEASREEQRTILDNLINRMPGIEAAGFADLTGREVLRRSRVELVQADSLQDRSREERFRNPLDTGEIWYGEVEFSPLTGEPLIPLGYPVSTLRSGEAAGVLLLELRARIVSELLREEDLRRGEDLYILDDQGRMFAHRISSLVLTERTVSSIAGPGITTGLADTPVIAATHSFSAGRRNYTAVAEISLRDAFMTVLLTVAATAGFAVAAVLVALPLALREAERITAPITTIANTARHIRDATRTGELFIDSLYRDSPDSSRHDGDWGPRVFRETMILDQAIRTMVDQLSRLVEETRSALEEREVLLREIHHRVKNNLQVIASLTNLQQQWITDESALLVSSAIHRRVYAMALVHMLLHESESLTHIDLGQYITALARHNLAEPDSAGVIRPINLYEDVGEFAVPIGRAVPLGLILGEIVSNAVRHAFLGDEEGTVSITADSPKPDSVRIVVHDSGSGIEPSCLSEEQHGLGLLLVRELTRQLGGCSDIRTADTGGTHFELTFPAG